MNDIYKETLFSPFQENVAFDDNSTILIWRNVQNLNYAPHWHTAMEVIIPMENSYKVSTPSKDYYLSPQDILIIPPGEIHSLYAPDKGLRYIYLIDISFLTKIKGFSTLQTLMSQPVHITQSDYGVTHKTIYNKFLEIDSEFFDKREYSEITIYSILLNIFAKLGYMRTDNNEVFSTSRNYKKNEYKQKITTVLDYIDMHYMDNISLDDMAFMAGFSKYHFSRLFAEYTGHTFSAYVNLKRIKVSEMLLLNDDLTITEIALQCGFTSICTFNRLFKSLKNCCPSEYRKLNHFH